MKLKVIEFIKDLGFGGAEKIVTDICMFLDKSKFEPVVVVMFDRPDTYNSKLLVRNGVRIIPIYKNTNKITYLFNELGGKNFYIPWRLKQIIKLEKPDVIHAHLYMLPFLNSVSRQLNGIRLFYTCHGEANRYFSGKHEKDGRIAKKLIDQHDMRIIGLNKEMVDFINKKFNVNNSIMIRNAIDFKRFEISEDRDDLGAQFGFKKSDFVVGNVGRFNEIKNHKFLIEIFKNLHEKNTNTRLLLIGNGVTFEDTKKQVLELGLFDYVVFAGRRTDIPQMLACMDVFCFPSKSEGLGIVLVEAQKMNLRIVMSDRVPKDVILTDKVCILSLDDSVDKWANAILFGKKNIDPKGRLEDWDFNKEIKRLESLYFDNNMI